MEKKKHIRNIILFLHPIIIAIIIIIILTKEKLINSQGNFKTSLVPILPFIITLLTTLIGAYFGARFAFNFQEKREKEKKNNDKIEEVIKTQLIILEQFQELINIKNVLLDKYTQNSWILMPPISTLKEEVPLKINLAKLYFLSNSKDDILFGEILLEQQRYLNCIKAINARSKMYIEHVQPILRNTKTHKTGYEQLLGEELSSNLKRQTQEMRVNILRTIDSHKKLSMKIKKISDKVFPKNNTPEIL